MAVVIDFQLLQILYGDSLGGTITEEIEMLLNWWIYHHTSVVYSKPVANNKPAEWLLMTDYGFESMNVLLKKYMLLKSEGVADARLKMFLCVSDCHNDKVGITFVN